MPELIYENDGSDECRFVLGKFGERNLICVGLNPSRAEPGNYDPTMKRVENWASMHGYDGHIMVNLYPPTSNQAFSYGRFEQFQRVDDPKEPGVRFPSVRDTGFRRMGSLGRQRGKAQEQPPSGFALAYMAGFREAGRLL